MIILSDLFSPISIGFIVIIVGYYIGQIKLFKISLGLSGVLIVAVFTGCLIATFPYNRTIINITDYQAQMKFFSDFGTALFVSSIGISTGSTLNFRRRGDIKAALVGSLMVLFSFITMLIISLADDNIPVSRLLGAVCGALTTTPGLSAACELENVIREEAILGYGYTYLFGVLATVLFVQTANEKISISRQCDENVTVDCEKEAVLGGLIQIGIAVILGRFIGNIEILEFSLGDSGGMLCSGIVVGLIRKKAFSLQSSTKVLTPLKNTGLVLFFVGNGISAGLKIHDNFDIKVIIYGVLMTLIPIAFGLIINKLFFGKRANATIIAGGMTSTPAICVLTENDSNISLEGYTLAYFGALITVMFLMRWSSFIL